MFWKKHSLQYPVIWYLDIMPSAATKTSFYLPSVDIEPFVKDPAEAAAQLVIDDVRRACLSTGFFQLKGHGVPLKLQKSIFRASTKFFALLTRVKRQTDARKTIGFRGYDWFETQSYELDSDDHGAEASRDIKEGFFASTDLPLDHPRVEAGRFLQGPNVWPDYSFLAHEDFRAIVEEYCGEMRRLLGRCDLRSRCGFTALWKECIWRAQGQRPHEAIPTFALPTHSW